MALSPAKAIAQTKVMLEWRRAEAKRLDRLYAYVHNKQRIRWLSSAVPQEVKAIAGMCRVNVLGLVVDMVAQSLYVDGYRAPESKKEDPAWLIWQQNRMDARQMAVHRSCATYDVGYATVLPGEPVPVIRSVSPRDMTTVYGEDDDWPMWALEKRRSAVRGYTLYRLFDADQVYWVDEDDGGEVRFISSEAHDRGHVPVVRFLAKADPDDEVANEFDDLIPIQDQINFTTFGLMVVQHFGAFPQRWIAGWTPEDEADDDDTEAQAAAKIAAARRRVGVDRILSFDDRETKLGEFKQADLSGYIDSRNDSLKNLASIAQAPAHALRGELVNLSAEALAAAEQAERRKIDERETMIGESWEQALAEAADISGEESDPTSQVRWRDTEARAFAATVDGLGKLAEMLQVPVEELWEKVPGTTKADIDRWKAARAKGDALAGLDELLRTQGTEA